MTVENLRDWSCTFNLDVFGTDDGCKIIFSGRRFQKQLRVLVEEEEDSISNRLIYMEI